ncbi:MAG: imidazole glycerol phosphate synthase subunit HisH [Nitrospirae bacterium]|nr:imidazole glycerol phosphate synthase subunit HisH [Nitrospirota bacterium]
MLLVLDLKISNLSSVVNALLFLGIPYWVSDRREDISKATHIIVPGVGTFEAGMSALKRNDLADDLIYGALDSHKPVLGICLGMQLMFEASDESPGVKGLSILPGKVKKLKHSSEYSLPRIGWDESLFMHDFLGFSKGQKEDFYYLHSYQVVPLNPDIVSIISGDKDSIISGIQKGNIYGVQFHPEKSHIAGLKLLEFFSNITV